MLTDALDLLAPSRCVGCRLPGPVLCAGCGQRLRAVGVHRRTLPGLDVVAAHGWSGEVRAAVVAFKERGRHGLAVPLGRVLAAAVRAGAAGPGDGGPVLLVPVPTRGAARRSRGHDHVLGLARAALPLLPEGSAVLPALRHVRRVADQAGLDRRQRARNLDGALGVRAQHAVTVRSVRSGPALVLIDDVVTTGATLAEAARALRGVAPGLRLRGAALALVGAQHHPDGWPRVPPPGPGKG